VNRIVFAAPDEAAARRVAEMLERRGIRANINGALGGEVLSDGDVARAQEMVAAASPPGPSPFPVRPTKPRPDVANALLGPRPAAPAPASAAAILDPSLHPEPASPRGRGSSDAANAKDAAWTSSSPAELARGKRELVGVLVGCVPLALTFLWFDQNPASLAWLSRVGRSALGNAVSSLELLICLSLVHRGRKDLRQLWGGSRHALPITLTAVLAGGVLFAVWWVVFHLLYQGSVPHLLPGAGGQSTVSPLDWLIFGLTTTIAAAATGLTIYGVVLKQLIALLRSRFVAVLMAAALATVVWNLAASPAQLGAELVRQILLAAAVVYAGRVWPVSLASAVCTVLIWIRFDRP